jgi:DNA primase catalytic core
MSNRDLIHFINNELYPAAFNNADTIFLEFQFKRQGGHWVSANKTKIDGSDGDKIGAVYIYQDNPYYIKDYTRDGKEISKYISERHGLSWVEAIRYLADKCGLQLPVTPFNDEQIRIAEKIQQKSSLYELINNYFTCCLNSEEDESAIRHRDYLKNRGYLNHGTGLGFIPSQDGLKQHLLGSGFGLKEINELFFDNIINNIGLSHQLTIPFKDNKGKIVGFAFRDIQLKEGNKYLYMTNFKKSHYLFNLKNTRSNKRSLILVEGLPDAITSHIHGMDNVVALGGNSISDEQIKLIKNSGAETITLCLDGDDAGTKATPLAIEKMLLNGVSVPIYVSPWPNSCSHKDPDEIIKNDGIEAFKSLIDNAKAWYNYLSSQVLENIPGNISDQYRDNAIKKLISIGSKIKHPTDQDSFLSGIDKKGAHLKISRDTLKGSIEKESMELEDKRHREVLIRESEKAVSLIRSGDKRQGLELLSKISKHNNTELLMQSYQSLLLPTSETDIREAIKNKPENISSGFKIKQEGLLMPSGAITIFAAPTSHGKTSFLINLALNIAQNPSNKPAYLFSYEESREAMLVKALNTYVNDETLSKNNRRSIESHFKNPNGDMEFILSHGEHRSNFIYKKDNFFTGLVQPRKLNVFYSDYTSEDLIGAIHYLVKNDNVGAVLIDYIQLLRLKNNKATSRQEELKQICLDLKNCAVETGLPIILGAQFNREVTSPDLMHPTKIGEAGDIERVANLIIGLWNNQFSPLNEAKIKGAQPHTKTSTITAKILKNRDGLAGVEEEFIFDGNTGKISNAILSDFRDFSSEEYKEAVDGH